MQLFYNPYINEKELEIGHLIALPDEEAMHAIRVLRNKPGDIIWLTNGKGGMIRGVIDEITKKNCSMKIEEIISDYGKKPFNIHMAVAPTKNINRFEWFLEKATEIGIDEITPLICTHSERKVVKTDRLEKIITAAMKQSLKAYHPKLNEPSDFKSFINSRDNSDYFMAHLLPEGQPLLKKTAQGATNITVLIGPEGDFSNEEVALARNAGIDVVGLGPERLRTETAALASVFTINFINL